MTERCQASLREVYEFIAKGFAERFRDVPEDLIPVMQEIHSRLGASGLILDVGCGHGRDAVWFEEHGHRVIGVDLSLQMLKLARQGCKGPVAVAEMSWLPLRSRCADAIWCNAALLHLPKSAAPAAIREFHLVLRPNGLLMISVQEGNHDGPRHSELWQVTRHVADYMASEVTSLLSANGFAVKHQTESPLPTVTWIQTLAVASDAA